MAAAATNTATDTRATTAWEPMKRSASGAVVLSPDETDRYHRTSRSGTDSGDVPAEGPVAAPTSPPTDTANASAIPTSTSSPTCPPTNHMSLLSGATHMTADQHFRVGVPKRPRTT